uniref:Uncharacterized protein n=1 Tax=Trichuris muris TaxID=70415 RepID=A0A5S6QTG3_TRIMR
MISLRGRLPCGYRTESNAQVAEAKCASAANFIWAYFHLHEPFPEAFLRSTLAEATATIETTVNGNPKKPKGRFLPYCTSNLRFKLSVIADGDFQSATLIGNGHWALQGARTEPAGSPTFKQRPPRSNGRFSMRNVLVESLSDIANDTRVV